VLLIDRMQKLLLPLLLRLFLMAGIRCYPCLYIMEMLTILFRVKLTTALADFWVAANTIKVVAKIVI
jgi:hypothetical protein